ncbi:unnamed protein product [Paramecium pentaurelia]|uniref:Uncharacterized protein n=1 Tax=Paramecium pentaurelia TaxID=43138 RepID=A0A8S1YGF9_9CILI|nr:unnamed protein product [Paramecium pentaurelia]
MELDSSDFMKNMKMNELQDFVCIRIAQNHFNSAYDVFKKFINIFVMAAYDVNNCKI